MLADTGARPVSVRPASLLPSANESRNFVELITLNRPQIIGVLNAADVEYEDFDGYQGLDDLTEAQQVAEALVHSQPGNLSFSWECNSEGEIQMASVGVYLPASGLYLTESIDRKNVTDDREATGTDAAVAYATAIMASFNKAIQVATVFGLTT